MSTPNMIKIKSLADWNNCFHPSTGAFRLPRHQGSTIHTLEIDLRYVDESHLGKGNGGNEIHLPNVCILILRGGEYCQDRDERVDCLVEVLSVINPVEVRWLHANGNLEDTFSLSIHMVHRAIIDVGQTWINLRNLVVQGGYPCPNLYAPTPFAMTPGTTPLPSPKLAHATFSGLQGMATVHPTFPNDRPTTPMQSTTGLTSIAEIPSHKARHMDPVRLAKRAERKRLAAYCLKPRFDYAFGSWAPEKLYWSFEGRYTEAAIRSVLANLVRSFATTFPSASEDSDELDLPSLIALKPVPKGCIASLQETILELQLEQDVQDYLQDVLFLALPCTEVNGSGPVQYARLFEDEYTSHDNERIARRWKSQMMLAGKDGSEAELVSLSALVATPNANEGLAPIPASQSMVSPSQSLASLASDTTDNVSEQEVNTPDMRGGRVLEPMVRSASGSASQSRSPSLEKGDSKAKGQDTNVLGMYNASSVADTVPQ